jgi:Photosynthetic reaction centre cytochrome C subunit
MQPLAALVLVALSAMNFAVTQGQAKDSQAPPEAARKAPAKPRIPDHFENLQVLPKEISQEQLVGLMKQLSVTFKVRCSYCHAVSDDLTEGNFSSDEKETKRLARELLRSVAALQRSKTTASGNGK